MTNNPRFIPIYVTDIKYESNPIYSLGSHSPVEYTPMSASGGFKIMGDPQHLAAVTEAMMSVHQQLYLTSANGLVAALKLFENNLPKYLTSPDEGEREIAQAIARLKGLGNQSNKEHKVAQDENVSKEEHSSEV